VWLRRRGHLCGRRRCGCVLGGEWGGRLHARTFAAIAAPHPHRSHRPTAQPHPGDAGLDDDLPPLPCGGEAAFAALGRSIAEAGGAVCHWGDALRVCVLGLGVVPSACCRLTGRRFPVTATAAAGAGGGRRAGAARGASGGDGDGDEAWDGLVRRHSARLHDSVSGAVLGRAALSGVGCVVGWMHRSSSSGSGGSGGGREWVWGRMPGAVHASAEKLLGMVLRGVDTGHRLEVVAPPASASAAPSPSTASGACAWADVAWRRIRTRCLRACVRVQAAAIATAHGWATCV